MKAQSVSSLLIQEPPLQVLPSLAKLLGLNEALVLQQLHYHMQNPNSGVIKNGFKWIYNTYEEWRDNNFPFWSPKTIQRVFWRLENIKLVLSEQLGQPTGDMKKYYRIDYGALGQLDLMDEGKLSRWIRTKCPDVKYESETLTERDDDEAVTRTKVFANFYEQNVGLITPLIADSIKDAVMDYPVVEWYEPAFKIAVSNNARSLNYVLRVLQGWKEHHFGWTPQFKKNGHGKNGNGRRPPVKQPELTPEEIKAATEDMARQLLGKGD